VYYILEKYIKAQYIFVILTFILMLTSVKQTYKFAKSTTKILKQNLGGDLLFGLHPGWSNFIKMSQWAAEHVPKDKKIASRKQDMSFVYTGREFYPIYSVPKISKDTLLSYAKQDTGLYFFAIKEIKNKTKKIDRLYEQTRFYIRAIINFETPWIATNEQLETFIIYSFPKSYTKHINSVFLYNKTETKTDIEGLFAEMKKKYSNYYIYDPDLLLKMLYKNNVEYAIVTNIMYKNDKGVSVNAMGSVNNYIHYIELKYPIASVINTIGKDSESSYLLQIHFDKLNKAVVKL